ncbi:hypothetical protein [Microcoleus sp. B4-C1]|uniref:hypothetical protein n=1 Tax=Microcoleus sp. B4-C1 TaxID=2818660 RepID=UPI002FCEA4EE
MPDFDVSSDRPPALSQESLERSRPSLSDSSYPLQYRGNNRLLALEAELRQKRQAIQDPVGHLTDGFDSSPTPPLRREGLSGYSFPAKEAGWGVRVSDRQNFPQAQPANPPQYQPTGRNRWLELERELQSRRQNNSLPQSDRPSIPAPPSPKPAIQRQVFDYNEPIRLQYHSNSFPRADPPTSDRAPPPQEVPAVSPTWQVANSQDEVNSEAISTLREPLRGTVSFANAPPPDNQQPPAVPDTEKPPAPKSPTLEELAAALLEIINQQTRPPVEVSTSSASPSPPQPEINANSRNAVSQQMGTDMPYATVFDLGTVELELEQLFDTFDREIEETEQANVVDLEQRFDEFDRALDAQQSDSPVKSKPASQTKRSGLGFAPKKP